MKEDEFYFLQIDGCLERIQAYTTEGEEAFFRSSMIQDAVIRNLELISAAASKISEDGKKELPAIPWRALAAVQKLLLYVDIREAWNTVEQNVGPIRKSLEPATAESKRELRKRTGN